MRPGNMKSNNNNGVLNGETMKRYAEFMLKLDDRNTVRVIGRHIHSLVKVATTIDYANNTINSMNSTMYRDAQYDNMMKYSNATINTNNMCKGALDRLYDAIIDLILTNKEILNLIGYNEDQLAISGVYMRTKSDIAILCVTTKACINMTLSCDADILTFKKSVCYGYFIELNNRLMELAWNMRSSVLKDIYTRMQQNGFDFKSSNKKIVTLVEFKPQVLLDVAALTIKYPDAELAVITVEPPFPHYYDEDDNMITSYLTSEDIMFKNLYHDDLVAIGICNYNAEVDLLDKAGELALDDTIPCFNDKVGSLANYIREKYIVM